MTDNKNHLIPSDKTLRALEDEYFAMHRLIADLFGDQDFGGLVESMTDGIYSDILKNIGAAKDRKYNPSTVYSITEVAVDGLFTSLSLVVFLAKLYQHQTRIEFLKKEVSRE